MKSPALKTKSITATRPHNPARNLQLIVKVTFFVLAGVSILGAASWSTYSLFELMSAKSAMWAAVMACGVLDVAWVASLAMLVADVYGGDWRAEIWSWGTMAASMAASALHGAQLHSWTVAVLGVLFTLASKGLTATYLHTLRPMLSKDDRDALKDLDYQRRMREIRRQKEAELAADDYRWNQAEPQFKIVELGDGTGTEEVQVTRVPVSEPTELELDVPNWVNSPNLRRPELEPARVNPVPVPPEPAPVVQVPEPAVLIKEVPAVPTTPPVVPNPALIGHVEIPSDRKGRVEHLAQEIGKRGGQLNSVPLSEVIDTYGLKPTAKATASNLRKDAHTAWLNNAPGTGNFM